MPAGFLIHLEVGIAAEFSIQSNRLRASHMISLPLKYTDDVSLLLKQ